VSCRRVKAKCELQQDDRDGVCRRCVRLKLVCDFQPIDEEETRRTAQRKRMRAQQLDRKAMDRKSAAPQQDHSATSRWVDTSSKEDLACPVELFTEWCMVAVQTQDLAFLAAALGKASDAGHSFQGVLGNKPLLAQFAALATGQDTHNSHKPVTTSRSQSSAVPRQPLPVDALEAGNSLPPHLSALMEKAAVMGGPPLCIYGETIVNGNVSVCVNADFERFVVSRDALATIPPPSRDSRPPRDAANGDFFGWVRASGPTVMLRAAFLHPSATASLETLKARLWNQVTCATPHGSPPAANGGGSNGQDGGEGGGAFVRTAVESTRLLLRFQGPVASWCEVEASASLTWGHERDVSKTLFALAFKAPMHAPPPAPPPQAHLLHPPPPQRLALTSFNGHAYPGPPSSVETNANPASNMAHDPRAGLGHQQDHTLAALLGPHNGAASTTTYAPPAAAAPPPAAAAANGMPPELFAVRALYDCVGERAGELTFRAGELISVTAGGPGDDWWEGRVDCGNDNTSPVRTGLFPCNYVSQSRVFRR